MTFLALPASTLPHPSDGEGQEFLLDLQTRHQLPSRQAAGSSPSSHILVVPAGLSSISPRAPLEPMPMALSCGRTCPLFGVRDHVTAKRVWVLYVSSRAYRRRVPSEEGSLDSRGLRRPTLLPTSGGVPMSPTAVDMDLPMLDLPDPRLSISIYVQLSVAADSPAQRVGACGIFPRAAALKLQESYSKGHHDKHGCIFPALDLLDPCLEPSPRFTVPSLVSIYILSTSSSFLRLASAGGGARERF
ncbi:hypothetical protein FB451DRAFT_1407854 [Mycena latifolia]|nr:hypothetical protein FB451DRAFT_1407854 [Mycena latifolia]